MSGTISFSFSKKVQPSKVVNTKLKEEALRDEGDEKEFVKGIDGNKIQTVITKEAPKELIIPLITKNNWRGVDQSTEKREPPQKKGKIVKDFAKAAPVPTSGDDIERLAIRELLQEGEEVGETSSEDVVVPLLLQNQIPEGYEQDDNMDVSLRPEQSTLEDYERIPIEQFGMAMMRGMGWSKETGIGRTNKGVVEMKEPSLRPKGLGLGAQKPTANKDVVSAQSNGREEKLVFKIGAYAVITKGPNKGMYGQINSFDEDNNRVIVKLAINSKMADISKFNLEIVSTSDYKTKSKVINNEKYEEYKARQEERGYEGSNYPARDRSRSLSPRSPPRRDSRTTQRIDDSRRTDSAHSARNENQRSQRQSSSSPERKKHKKSSHHKDKKKHKKRRHRSTSSSSRSSQDKRRHHRKR